MLRLDQGITIDLAHCAGLVRPAAPSSALIVSDLALTICDFTAGTAATLTGTPETLTSAAAHPLKPIVAIVDGLNGALRIIGHDGTPIFADAAPALHQDTPSWVRAGFSDCYFDTGGSWCAASLSEHDVEVQLRETGNWSIVAKHALADPVGGSRPLFFPAGPSATVVLWLPAGQDGSAPRTARSLGRRSSA